MAQTIDRHGLRGPEVRVSSLDDTALVSPRVATMPNGEGMVAWNTRPGATPIQWSLRYARIRGGAPLHAAKTLAMGAKAATLAASPAGFLCAYYPRTSGSIPSAEIACVASPGGSMTGALPGEVRISSMPPSGGVDNFFGINHLLIGAGHDLVAIYASGFTFGGPVSLRRAGDGSALPDKAELLFPGDWPDPDTQAVARLPGGGYAVLFSGWWLQRFNADGEHLLDEFIDPGPEIHERGVDLVLSPDGRRLLIAGTVRGQDTCSMLLMSVLVDGGIQQQTTLIEGDFPRCPIRPRMEVSPAGDVLISYVMLKEPGESFASEVWALALPELLAP